MNLFKRVSNSVPSIPVSFFKRKMVFFSFLFFRRAVNDYETRLQNM